MPPDQPRTVTAAVCAAPAEKPATQNYQTEQQHHAVSNPYRHGLAEDQHMLKNDKDQHDGREKKTGLPRHAVAKKTFSELQKPSIGNETHSDKNEPWDDHKRSSLETEISHGRASWQARCRYFAMG